MNLPNSLTLLRIALIPFIITLLYTNQTVYAAGLFIIASLLDLFDGLLARRLNQVTDLGKLMDPVADKILVLGTLIILVDLKMAQAIPVVIIVAREFFISGWRSLKASQGNVIAARFTAKAKTVLQILAVLMLILKLPFANEILWLAVAASIYSGVEYVGGNRSKTR